MSEETPKLYTNKPKKAQLKQSTATSASSSPASAAAASYKMGSQSTAPPPPPPPPPQKESFARRYKFLWPLFLTVNLAVGVYVFMRTTKKETGLDEEKPTNGSSTQVPSTTISTSPVTEKLISSSSAILEPVKPREPIPEHQQRQLFKWILEEKRKVKPKDPEEKKRIDEEKAILKEFIRAKTIPKI